MNIVRSSLPAADDSPDLEPLYRRIPGWREILAAVKAGHAEFMDLLAAKNLLEFGVCTSDVHPYHDIEVHAFILGITSEDRWDEIQTKSYLTYASHWIDDFFDSPRKVGDPAQLLNDRGDIRRTLANMGAVGKIGVAMANRVAHPEAIYKTLHRMLYGGLVQRSTDYAQRHALVDEYQAVAARFVDPRLIQRIRRLQPQAYWTTNKTVMEMSCSAEKRVDYNTAELWNLVYAPALYLQDADEERARGELNFEEEEAPRLTEMIKMIRLGARYLSRIYQRSSPPMRQLEFVALSIPNLPPEVVTAYRSLLESL